MQKKIHCPYCDELIMPNAKKCRFCDSNLKKKKEKNIKIGKLLLILLAGGGIILAIFFILLIYMVFNVDNKYTGQELFDAINEHREGVGVKKLEIDSKLCDNLVERWFAIREPGNGHKGFEEWAISEGIIVDGVMIEPYDKEVGMAELYANGTQTYWLIDFWTGSPGHKAALENPNYNVGCSYASDGTGVIIMAKRK